MPATAAEFAQTHEGVRFSNDYLALQCSADLETVTRDRCTRPRVCLTRAAFDAWPPLLCFLLAVPLMASEAELSSQSDEPAPVSESCEPKSDAYSIHIGDELDVFVWKEPELSQRLVVRMDGRVTVPLVGDLEVLGHSTEEVAADLTTALGQFVEVPHVTVSVLRGEAARFFVIGQVLRSGAFRIVGPTTVLQAVALAGGFTPFAKPDRILIIRVGESGEEILNFDFEAVKDGKDLEQNITLQRYDTIVVP